MNAFSAREVALDAYRVARGAPIRPPMGGTLIGVRQADVDRRRRELFQRAEAACLTALDGPPKFTFREPDNDALRALLVEIRRELAPSNEVNTGGV
ncbi:hypothetical protein JOF29_007950 [Kribbella aluminosa]|uniref:Uncharacterized protein n=1 Tax=Kribbella aluminosa TaxID=416017 RepID=A0ABS4UYV1_9ACTN|nr:hypothetical protein [Kribbella aluminosa]MBP2356840.1 hypothetical protein [Kribbella aluminosa]